MADSSIVYAFLDDGPYKGETLRITPERGGAPPRTIDLADPAAPEFGTAAVYVLLGPHHNDEWWIYRLARPET